MGSCPHRIRLFSAESIKERLATVEQLSASCSTVRKLERVGTSLGSGVAGAGIAKRCNIKCDLAKHDSVSMSSRFERSKTLSGQRVSANLGLANYALRLRSSGRPIRNGAEPKPGDEADKQDGDTSKVSHRTPKDAATVTQGSASNKP